ncbi:MAG TPA: molecular chaperone DnaJ [Gemmatimonadota bacterium]|nr:molecular chaperone DnaJ [Gemmatimonadota bacterium]
MNKRDYYEVLGVARDADPDTIKRAYRGLAMSYHPDRNPDDPDAGELFKEASEAYEILRDPERRARYDRFGHAGVRSGAGATSFDFDLADALRAFMRDFGGFEDLFGRGRGPRTRGPLRGTDAQMRMRVTLEEVATGVEKTIRAHLLQPCARCGGSGSVGGAPVACSQCGGRGEVQRAQRSIFGQFVSIQPCPACHGEGTVVSDPCPECRGEGRTRAERRIKVRIPPGVDTGNFLTLRGEGNAGPRGGPPGDLLVVIEVKPHERFIRQGDDVVLELSISFPQAALGAEIEVPTLHGSATLEVPPGTQNDAVLKLEEKGLPLIDSDRRGDQLVRVRVWVPKRLTAEERARLENLRESENLAPPGEEGGFWRKVKEAFTA